MEESSSATERQTFVAVNSHPSQSQLQLIFIIYDLAGASLFEEVKNMKIESNVYDFYAAGKEKGRKIT